MTKLNSFRRHPFGDDSERNAVRHPPPETVEHRDFEPSYRRHAVILLRARRIETVGKRSWETAAAGTFARTVRISTNVVRTGISSTRDDGVSTNPTPLTESRIRASLDDHVRGDCADLRFGGFGMIAVSAGFGAPLGRRIAQLHEPPSFMTLDLLGFPMLSSGSAAQHDQIGVSTVGNHPTVGTTRFLAPH